MRPLIILGPPAVGKSAYLDKHPDLAWDPEETIDWPKMIAEHGRRGPKGRLKFEHELDWAAVWFEQVLPRIWAALLLQKHVVTGMLNPFTAEMIHRLAAARPSHTMLFIPPESRHFSQAWGHVARRPRTWGSGLLGWQHTFANRLLARGLGADLHLKTVERLRLSPIPSRPAGTAFREAILGSRRFIEVFHGQWAELDERDQLIAMLTSRAEPRGVRLSCDQSAALCGVRYHDCSAQPLLRNGVHRRPLSQWVATDKLRPARAKKNAIVYFAGSLAPIHRTHVDILDAAKRSLEKAGWHVLGGYVAVREQITNKDLGALSEVLMPAKTRAAMAQLALSESTWLMPDRPATGLLDDEGVRQGSHPTQQLAARLRASGALERKVPVTIFWVNGPDAVVPPAFYEAFARVADSDPTTRLRVLIAETTRRTTDQWAGLDSGQAASRYRMKGEGSRSSTAVRTALQTFDRNALRAAVGLPLVEMYLLGLMHQRG